MYKTVFLTLFYTGLRKGEFCGLSLDDPDEKNCELHLHHTVKSLNGTGATLSTKFKNSNSKRIVPIPEWLVPMLKKELEKEQYPFLHKYRSLSTTYDRYHKRTNLKRIRIHDFRHSYASMLISKGVDIYTVSQTLGHADIQTTVNVYGHLYPDKRKEITNILSKINWS